MDEQRGDLNPLDYGIWSQIEARVWGDKPQTLIDLRTSILKHISEFPQGAIEKCFPSPPKSMAMCIQDEGGNFDYKFKNKARIESKKKNALPCAL